MMTTTTARRQPNHSDRAACWLPENWLCHRVNPQHYLLTNVAAPVEFEVWDAGDGAFTVRGHSGEPHTLLLGCCTCKGKDSALSASRLCPHEAAVVAVERFKDDERGETHPLTPEEEEQLEQDAREEWGLERDEQWRHELREALAAEFAATPEEMAAAWAEEKGRARRTEELLSDIYGEGSR